LRGGQDADGQDVCGVVEAVATQARGRDRRVVRPDGPNCSACGSDRLFVIPSSSNRKCLVGSANGEFRIGFSIETGGTGSLGAAKTFAFLAG